MKKRKAGIEAAAINRRSFLQCAAVCGAGLGFAPLWSSCAAPRRAAAVGPAKRPNIVMLMVDDMGYSDIGCYGAEIRTPNIDGLAEQGVRLTQFYTNPVCTPTRASLLTGCYAHQAGLATNNTWPSDDHGLYGPDSDRVKKRGNSFWQEMQFPAYNVLRTDTCTTIGHALKAAGYRTFMSGKWHVGDEKKYWPCNQGFDRSFVMIWGGGGHFAPTWCPYALDDQVFTDFPKDFYTTDYFFRYGMEFIEQRDPDQPFFLYLTPSAPHAPYQAWPEDIKKYDGVYDAGWDEVRRKRLEKQIALGLYPSETELPPRIAEQAGWSEEERKQDAVDSMEVLAAMVDRVDRNLGELIAFLRRRGELENTVFMFFSDNGGTPTAYGQPRKAFHPWGETRNTPCSKQKGWTHEGGIRSPFIMCWPGHLPAGAINRDYPGHVMDILPTCLDIAGTEYPRESNGRRLEPLEGTSLLPALRDPSYAPPRTLCWEFSGSGAIRDGDFKLVREYTDQYFGKGEATQRTGPWRLYNVRTDPGEIHDLVAQYPEKARELEAQYLAWEKRVGVVPHETVLERQAEFRARNRT